MLKRKTERNSLLASCIGVVAFIVLYYLATLLYPGGSQADKTMKGFSWINNYWCNLLNETAINGEHNSARPVAMAAMLILGLSMLLFWYQLPLVLPAGKWYNSVRFTGIVSTVVSMFIFTSWHDRVIDISGLLGLFALLATLTGLYKKKIYGLFIMGCCALALCGVNYYMALYRSLLLHLPVVQKITFLYFLLWIFLINLLALRTIKYPKENS